MGTLALKGLRENGAHRSRGHRVGGQIGQMDEDLELNGSGDVVCGGG
jgi:hypothetical protein